MDSQCTSKSRDRRQGEAGGGDRVGAEGSYLPTWTERQLGNLREMGQRMAVDGLGAPGTCTEDV